MFKLHVGKWRVDHLLHRKEVAGDSIRAAIVVVVGREVGATRIGKAVGRVGIGVGKRIYWRIERGRARKLSQIDMFSDFWRDFIASQ